jgi:hypothetical protein
MTDWCCSVCWKNTPARTIVAGTVICELCLEKVAKENRNNNNTLKEDLKNAIIKHGMGDIYD